MQSSLENSALPQILGDYFKHAELSSEISGNDSMLLLKEVEFQKRAEIPFDDCHFEHQPISPMAGTPFQF